MASVRGGSAILYKSAVPAGSGFRHSQPVQTGVAELLGELHRADVVANEAILIVGDERCREFLSHEDVAGLDDRLETRRAVDVSPVKRRSCSDGIENAKDGSSVKTDSGSRLLGKAQCRPVDLLNAS
jgi:hypothetical protein